jgi:single-strand DNA-binding protein
VCSFGIATNRSWTSADTKEKQERVDFHNIVAWSKLAEICGQLLHKGDKVYVDGRIQTRDWKTEEGADRRITEIVIDNMMLLGGPRGGGAPREEMPTEEVASAEPETEDKGKGKGSKAKRGKKAEVKEEIPADSSVESAEDVSDDIPF